MKYMHLLKVFVGRKCEPCKERPPQHCGFCSCCI